MIKTATQLKALIRNKAAGDSDKAQVLLRITPSSFSCNSKVYRLYYG